MFNKHDIDRMRDSFDSQYIKVIKSYEELVNWCKYKADLGAMSVIVLIPDNNFKNILDWSNKQDDQMVIQDITKYLSPVKIYQFSPEYYKPNDTDHIVEFSWEIESKTDGNSLALSNICYNTSKEWHRKWAETVLNTIIDNIPKAVLSCQKCFTYRIAVNSVEDRTYVVNYVMNELKDRGFEASIYKNSAAIYIHIYFD